MHRGIARQFSEKFGNIPYIKAQASAGTSMAVIRLQNGSFIYYLITKEKVFPKANFEIARTQLGRDEVACGKSRSFSYLHPRK